MKVVAKTPAKKKAAKKKDGPPDCRRCGGPAVLVHYPPDDDGGFFYACENQCEDQVFSSEREALAQWTRWEGDKVRNREHRRRWIQIDACVQWMKYLAVCRSCRSTREHKDTCACKRLYPRDYMRTMQARGMLSGRPRVGNVSQIAANIPPLVEEG